MTYTKWLSISVVLMLCISCSHVPSALVAAQSVLQTVKKQPYVKGTEDLPLFVGFVPVEHKTLSYDSPSGRIIDALFYNKNTTKEQVEAFYSKTLPQLGWQEKEPFSYVRDKEHLRIYITKNIDRIYLQFKLSPL